MATKDKIYDIIRFKGHYNIRATHPTTLEITKDSWLTPRGDCIIGILSDKACSDINKDLKTFIKSGGELVITLLVGNKSFQFKAFGDHRLTLQDKRSIVIRKTSFISPRTLAIRSEASARDIPREMVKLLKKGAEGALIISSVKGSFSPFSSVGY